MDRPEDADESLMIQYKSGDARAFETLYQRHKGPLYRFIRRQCADASAAEELFQDVWMNLIRSRRRYRVRAKFTTFLYHIAHNRLIDFYRSSAKYALTEPEVEVDSLAGSTGSTEARVDITRQYEQLQRRIFALPREQREAFLLHEESGLSIEEIALTTGVGRETAKKRLRYAVRKLRENWLEEKP